MTALLRFEDVSLGYGDRRVLEGLTFEVQPGTFIAVSGASGSGKSTLLRAAAGLLEPQAGKVERSSPTVGWVPQETTLGRLHPVSAEEVVRAAGGPTGQEARAALGELGLEGLARKPFNELSGGQRQRVLVARALASHRPGSATLLVFDEPTSALDEASAALVREAARARVRDGSAVLYATHQPGDLGPDVDLELLVTEGRVETLEPS